MGENDSKPNIAIVNLPANLLESQDAFLESESRFKGFSGPIGSGKSYALCLQAIKSSYANPGRLGLLGAPTYQMLRDSTQKAFFELLETYGLAFDYLKSENTVEFKTINSKVLFRSMEEYERLRGTNLAWFGLDELSYTQEEAWLRLEGRLRDPRARHLCGFGVWTPKGFDWIYKKFLKDESGNYKVILARPFENEFLLKAVPDFYDRLRKSYDAQFFEQEALGSYVSLSGGLVYRAFDRAEHVRAVQVDPTRPLLWALDFNVDPMSSVVVQVIGEEAFVVGEIILSRATTHLACEEFHRRYGSHKAGIRIYGDASGNNMHTTGSTDYQVIRDFFRTRMERLPEQRVPRTNPMVRDRISLVNGRLKNADGDIRLSVDPRCKELIADFEQLAFQEGTMIPDKTKDPRRSHASDALGYLLWQEFHTAAAGFRPERLI